MNIRECANRENLRLMSGARTGRRLKRRAITVGSMVVIAIEMNLLLVDARAWVQRTV